LTKTTTLKNVRTIIIYKVGEMDADSAADRNESDLAYVTELLDSVFKVKIKPERNGVVKVYRLGRWDSAKEVPRPLLVMFNDPKSKDRVMSSLRYLRDADAPFKGISIAHDMIFSAIGWAPHLKQSNRPPVNRPFQPRQYKQSRRFAM